MKRSEWLKGQEALGVSQEIYEALEEPQKVFHGNRAVGITYPEGLCILVDYNRARPYPLTVAYRTEHGDVERVYDRHGDVVNTRQMDTTGPASGNLAVSGTFIPRPTAGLSMAEPTITGLHEGLAGIMRNWDRPEMTRLQGELEELERERRETENTRRRLAALEAQANIRRLSPASEHANYFEAARSRSREETEAQITSWLTPERLDPRNDMTTMLSQRPQASTSTSATAGATITRATIGERTTVFDHESQAEVTVPTAQLRANVYENTAPLTSNEQARLEKLRRPSALKKTMSAIGAWFKK